VSAGSEVRKGDVLARLEEPKQLLAALKGAELEQLAARQVMDTLNKKADLATRDARAALLRAEKMVIDTQQLLDKLDTTAYKQQIDDAWVEAQTAKTDLQDAQTEFDKYKDLAEDNATRKRTKDTLDAAQTKYNDAIRKHDLLQNALDQAKADAEVAQSALKDAQKTMDARSAGPDPDELALAQARLDAAEAQYNAALAARDDLEITAPYDGVVVQVEISVGEQARPGVQAVRIADFSAWYVETTDVTEMEVVQIDTSRPVILIPDALSSLELTGEVESISQYYTEKTGDILYTVRVRLTDTDPRLRWGMTMNMEFGKVEEGK
jgi:multidrug resistance efflux pump